MIDDIEKLHTHSFQGHLGSYVSEMTARQLISMIKKLMCCGNCKWWLPVSDARKFDCFNKISPYGKLDSNNPNRKCTCKQWEIMP